MEGSFGCSFGQKQHTIKRCYTPLSKIKIMSWFEGLFGGKQSAASSSSEKKEPVLPTSTHEVTETAKAAEAQQEVDEKAIEVIRARLNGELPASDDQEHIDLPIEEIDVRKAAYEQLVPYVLALKALEQAAGGGAVTETTLNSSGFDQTLKETAATLKKTGRHPNWTEREIQVDLVKLVREGKLPQLIYTYDTRLMEEKERIALLEGKQTIKNTRDAWRRMERNER